MSDIDDLLRKASDMRIDNSPCPEPSFSTDELRAARLELARLRRAVEVLRRIADMYDDDAIEHSTPDNYTRVRNGFTHARAILAEIDGKEEK